MAPTNRLLPQGEGQLQAKSGKCAKIESSTRNEKIIHKIVAKHMRGDAPKVSLWTLAMEDRNVCMAFCFKQNNQKFFAAANTETSKIQVEQLNNVDDVDSKFLFRWGNPNLDSEKWNNLCSVAEPSKYLSVSGNAFTLSTSQETLFKFMSKDKKDVIENSQTFTGKSKVRARRMVSNRLSR